MQLDGPARIARAVLSRARVDARVLDVDRRELERTRLAHAVIVAAARNQVAVLAPEHLRWEKSERYREAIVLCFCLNSLRIGYLCRS